MAITVPTIQELPFEVRLQLLLGSMRSISEGKDETIRALRNHVDALGTRVILVGGVAVILNGYERTTDDRDVLVDYRDVRALADRLSDDPDWERLEIRKYAFRYLPTGIQVDFLVSRDLMKLGLPYYFPDVEQLESTDNVEGVAVMGLHDLLFLKLIAGRMLDLADVMELCKRHLNDIQVERVVGRLQPEDSEIREKFLEVLRNAPLELAEERRLGQQDVDYPEHPQSKAERLFRQQGRIDLGLSWWGKLLGLYTPATIEIEANELNVEGLRFRREEITRLRSKRRRRVKGLEIVLGSLQAPETIVFWSPDVDQLKAELEKRGWKVDGT